MKVSLFITCLVDQLRPSKGSLGNAPRTLDVRGPMREYFDLAFQKNFPFPSR